MEDFEGLPDIEEFLSNQNSENDFSIRTNELDHISDAIVAHCGFTKEQATRIINMFFNEIRYHMLKGYVIDIKKLGSFYIASPKLAKNKKRVFPKFKPKKSLLKELNNEK